MKNLEQRTLQASTHYEVDWERNHQKVVSVISVHTYAVPDYSLVN